MTQIWLTARDHVQLENGVLLKPGKYRGRSMKRGISTWQPNSGTPDLYFLELDAQQIRAMGGVMRPQDASPEFDVTEHIESGAIRIG